MHGLVVIWWPKQFLILNMKTSIAFLSGINVSGHKKILMAELREMLDKLKFSDARTYIQSGNIAFKSDENDVELLANKLKQGIQDTFGFDVPVLVIEASELQQIFDDNPFKKDDPKKVCFVLLKSIPDANLVTEMDKISYPDETFVVTDNCVYLRCLAGFARAKCSNNLFERKLKVQATTRNFNTMVKMIEMSK